MKKFSLVLTTLSFLSACAPRSASDRQPPVVQKLDTVATDDGLESQVRFQKSEILNGRSFLFSSDLQYSALHDKNLDLSLQSLAIGHLVAQFRLAAGSLQLVADQRLQFESDVNHPGRLIYEFPIVAQDTDSVTVRIDRASPLSSSLLEEASFSSKRSWIRSIEFVKQGNYLLLETSVESSNGSIAEFMESVFPRDTLVPQGFEGLPNDPDASDWAARFRFLSSGAVWTELKDKGRQHLPFANRFLASPDKPLEWYVTPNIPDAYLRAVETGVEGWNRYAVNMWGKDFVRFKGRLPAGIKLGDPRYNIINWDNVAEAGAAYESQASDPSTGLQSHSLIYLPLAWVNIGKDFWNRGSLSEGQSQVAARVRAALKSHRFFGKSLEVGCLDAGTEQLSQALLQESPDDFAVSLLKGVIFHEVGHALGLAHNFKGSLSYDDEKPESFSTSIMDYNQYQLERGVFDGNDKSTGPLLEYDRQILSVLYNQGRDVKATDPVLPACADQEADSVEKGVDPLCIRYDAGHDPTETLRRSIELLTRADAHLGATQSLARALTHLADSDLKDGSELKNAAALDGFAKKFGARTAALVGFYISSGAESVNYLTRTNLRFLNVFVEGSLPESYDAPALRGRALDGLRFVASLTELPEASRLILDQVLQRFESLVRQSPAVLAEAANKREELVQKTLKTLKASTDLLASKNDTDDVLSKVRARVLGSIKREPKAPFFVGAVGNSPSLDLEAELVGVLRQNLLSRLPSGSIRPFAERQAVALSLKTFADTTAGHQALQEVEDALNAELRTLLPTEPKAAEKRENLRALLKIVDVRENNTEPPTDND